VRQLNIGFVGAGKVGTSLAGYLAFRGLTISGFFVQTDTLQLKTNFKTYSDFDAFLEATDVIFLTVRDNQIESVAEEIARRVDDLSGKTFAHTSGSNSLKVLKVLEEKYADIFTMHPLQTFSHMFIDPHQMTDMHLFVESGKGIAIEHILNHLGNPAHKISSEGKSTYHCAASIISNLTTGLIDLGFELMEQLGVDREDSQEAFKALAMQSIKNIMDNGTHDSLTGPVPRGDYTTVAKHLSVLDANQKEIYLPLARRTLEMSRDRLDDATYDAFTEIIGGKN
jgi:predicted short-subunit dehydrogenase-like oxidoreductase (DUF2520 family)